MNQDSMTSPGGKVLERACAQGCSLRPAHPGPAPGPRTHHHLFVDVDSRRRHRPAAAHDPGVDGCAEVFFDDVVRPRRPHAGPSRRRLAELAADLLPYERSTCFWHRVAYLYTRLDRLSVDKVLLATAEQQLYDTARDLLPGAVELTETPWRSEYLYSRAATIYGGTAEIQRNIIARPAPQPGERLDHGSRRLRTARRDVAQDDDGGVRPRPRHGADRSRLARPACRVPRRRDPDGLPAARRDRGARAAAQRRVAQRGGHALDRIQFGRPLASFQAVRRRLAETLVALDGAEATLLAATASEDDNGLSCLLAKAAAGHAALTAARHCQQVLGGIGFTAEHGLHRHVRRALVLDGLLGSSGELTREAGRLLRKERSAPRLIHL